MYVLRYENTAKRVDLDFRLKHIELETRIFEIAERVYRIYCKGYIGSFEELEEEFNYEFRPLGKDISIIRYIPARYKRELDRISFDNPVYGFKSCVETRAEVVEFIRGLFPAVDVIGIKVEPGINFKITVLVGKDTTVEDCEAITKELLDKDIDTDDVNVQCVEGIPRISNDVLNDPMRLCTNKNILCSTREVEYWFEYAEKIYSGDVKREQIPFFRKKGKKCFLDFTVFDNIDLRKALLLYDVLYVALPLKDKFEIFLMQQRTNRKELIELAHLKRIVFVLTNAENRYDVSFINELYHSMPSAVIGRRAINSIMAAYFTELNERFTKNYPNAFDYAKELFKYARENEDVNTLEIAKCLLWPTVAKAKSFGFLNNNGIFAISNYGVNNVLEKLLCDIPGVGDKFKENIGFEFMVNSYPIHLAVALDATYMPFQSRNGEGCYSDSFVASAIERMLVAYWYNTNQTNFIDKCRIGKCSEKIKLYDCNANLSLIDIANLSTELKTTEKFEEILEKYNKLTEQERATLLGEYNKILFDVSQYREKNNKWKSLLIAGAGLIPIDIGFAFALTFFQLYLKRMEDALDKVVDERKFNKIVDEVSDKKYTSEELADIHLLKKMYGVAYLK